MANVRISILITSIISLLILLIITILEISVFTIIRNSILSSIIFTVGTNLTWLRSPVDSLLCLITAFIGTIILLWNFNVEFLAFAFGIVYIGAVAILFLFVIILFNLTEIFKTETPRYGLRLIFVGSVLLIILYIIDQFITTPINDVIVLNQSVPDVLLLVPSLYNQYGELFLVVGWTLLVALVGALTISLSGEISISSKNTK